MICEVEQFGLFCSNAINCMFRALRHRQPATVRKRESADPAVVIVTQSLHALPLRLEKALVNGND